MQCERALQQQGTSEDGRSAWPERRAAHTGYPPQRQREEEPRQPQACERTAKPFFRQEKRKNHWQQTFAALERSWPRSGSFRLLYVKRYDLR